MSSSLTVFCPLVFFSETVVPFPTPVIPVIIWVQLANNVIPLSFAPWKINDEPGQRQEPSYGREPGCDQKQPTNFTFLLSPPGTPISSVLISVWTHSMVMGLHEPEQFEVLLITKWEMQIMHKSWIKENTVRRNFSILWFFIQTQCNLWNLTMKAIWILTSIWPKPTYSSDVISRIEGTAWHTLK